MSSAATNKQEIRRVVLDTRRHMTPMQRAVASETITRRFLRSREFFAASTVACFFPMADEVDTRVVFERCWRKAKRVFAPVLTRKHGMFFREVLRETTLEKNEYGIWEPVDGATIDKRLLDIVVTPLVAADENGNRIGMGGGYFDRCFSYLRYRHVWRQPKLVALAFDCQKVEKITPNPWDIPLYRVYSE